MLCIQSDEFVATDLPDESCRDAWLQMQMVSPPRTLKSGRETVKDGPRSWCMMYLTWGTFHAAYPSAGWSVGSARKRRTHRHLLWTGWSQDAWCTCIQDSVYTVAPGPWRNSSCERAFRILSPVTLMSSSRSRVRPRKCRLKPIKANSSSTKLSQVHTFQSFSLWCSHFVL